MLSSIYWLPEAAHALFILSASCRNSSCLRSTLNDIAERCQVHSLSSDFQARRFGGDNFVVVHESETPPMPLALPQSPSFTVEHLARLQQARHVDVADLDLIPHEVLVEMDRNHWTLARAWREHLGLRPNEAANEAGLSTQEYLRIEGGSARSSRFVRLLAAGLDLQPSQLRQAPLRPSESTQALVKCAQTHCRSRRSMRKTSSAD